MCHLTENKCSLFTKTKFNKTKKDEVLLPQVVKKLALRKPFIAT